MKNALIALVFIIATTTVAFAQSYNSSQVGNQTYTYGSDGYNATSTTVGNQTYTNDNQGHNCTTSRVGNQVYTNCN